MNQAELSIGDRVVLAEYDPMVGRSLIGCRGVVTAINTVQATVRFDGDSTLRWIHLRCLRPIKPGSTSAQAG